MLLLLRVSSRGSREGWKGGQIGEDGPFIFNETPKSKSEAEQAYDGHEEDGTTWVEPQTNEFGLKFSQAGGTFRTNTVTVEVSLSGKATSGLVPGRR